jgi:hypothetical protein
VKEGILWFDPSAKLAPQAKLGQAAARFAERCGRPANCCHVHPDEVFAAVDITIVPDPAVRPRHMWVGRDESLVVRRTRKRTA